MIAIVGVSVGIDAGPERVGAGCLGPDVGVP